MWQKRYSHQAGRTFINICALSAVTMEPGLHAQVNPERIDTSSIQVTVISSIRTFVDIDAPNAERSESVSTLTVVSTRRIHAARIRRAPVLTRRTLVNVITY